jgi:hypothetical protein
VMSGTLSEPGWAGGALTQNGYVYCAPISSTMVLKIGSSSTPVFIPIDCCASRYFYKL